MQQSNVYVDSGVTSARNDRMMYLTTLFKEV